jgi:hypothetical protein
LARRSLHGALGGRRRSLPEHTRGGVLPICVSISETSAGGRAAGASNAPSSVADCSLASAYGPQATASRPASPNGTPVVAPPSANTGCLRRPQVPYGSPRLCNTVQPWPQAVYTWDLGPTTQVLALSRSVALARIRPHATVYPAGRHGRLCNPTTESTPTGG